MAEYVDCIARDCATVVRVSALATCRLQRLVRVIAAASFQRRFGHKHRSFINPEVTARPTATKGALNNRQHFRVRSVAPWADVGGGDADFRPSFHGFGECKALATEKAHHFIVNPRVSARFYRVSTRGRRDHRQSSRPRDTAACPKCGATIRSGACGRADGHGYRRHRVLTAIVASFFFEQKADDSSLAEVLARLEAIDRSWMPFSPAGDGGCCAADVRCLRCFARSSPLTS